jgi:hypothetical protein
MLRSARKRIEPRHRKSRQLGARVCVLVWPMPIDRAGMEHPRDHVRIAAIDATRVTQQHLVDLLTVSDSANLLG